MLVFQTTLAFQTWRNSLSSDVTKNGVGLVPTMGALHAGHAALLTRAKKENQITILTLFVNPTQFNRPDDFTNYPKTMEADLILAESLGVDAVFAPKDKTELYPDDYTYQISENTFSKLLCGEHRPGHFEGVLTIVMKLFQLAKASHAYFGEKDYQQLKLIDGMARAFFLDTKVVACPTVREEDGLAMSSRNLRLDTAARKLAPTLHQLMEATQDLESARTRLTQLGFEVDYLEEHEVAPGFKRRFVAASLNGVRLIDNIPVSK